MAALIDMHEIGARHRSDRAAARSRRRHRAETRLKMYGLVAIGLAAAALGLLVWSIAERTAGVLYENYLVLETTVALDERDRARVEDPNPRVMPSLGEPLREAMAASLPKEPGRREMRQLIQLLSADAGLELGQQVKADPSLVGRTISFPALLDDELQMYLKGGLGELIAVDAAGQARPEAADGAVRLDLDPAALDRARAVLADIRRRDAALAAAEAARQANAVEAIEARLAEAESGAREALEGRLAGYVEARDRALAEAERLRALAADPDGVFTLAASDPSVLIALNGGWLKATELAPGRATAVPLVAPDTLAPAAEGTWRAWVFTRPEAARNVSDLQIAWIEDFRAEGAIESRLNTRLLTASDSSNAELAGIWGALVGSFWTMMVTFGIAFPIGVLASIYLEEFAPKNRMTDFIEVNINNLAAVPSIVFGLLGLAIFVSGIDVTLFGHELRIGGFLPRSSPIAGGTVLALMTLPTIIIAGRAALRAVPPSIREAALGLGASRLQMATHHVLPLAMPGIMTGAIIGMAQALGETAPLLLVGMNSFIQEPPATPFDPANVLPTLIYQWNNNSERLFDEKTAAAISVLLIFLVAMNALAVLLRKRFERRW